MIFCFDIDGVICSSVERSEYEKAKPNLKIIKIINRLYGDGNIIKIYTSRGQTTGTDLKTFTINQLKEWDVKHHELIMGKPHFDLYICDKSVFVSRFIKAYEDLIR